MHPMHELETYLTHGFVQCTAIHLVLRIPYLCKNRPYVIVCTCTKKTQMTNLGCICIFKRYLQSGIETT